MPRFEINPQGPYSFIASVAFLEGFTPAAYANRNPDHLYMVFVLDGTDTAVGIDVYQDGDSVVGEVVGTDHVEAVRRQVARILSLDVDGSRFAAVGEHDPVVGHLQARYPNLRPVCFYSTYEAAAWALIGQRIRIVEAAKIKAAMAKELGTAVTINGVTEYAFPTPARLRQVDSFRGLTDRKIEYLHRLAEATMEGALDAILLRSMPPEQAIEHLKKLYGIGDFSAEHILLRGAGDPDYLSAYEPRLRRAVALAYGLNEEPDADTLTAISDKWRPYRTWVTFLLRVMLEAETGEIKQGRRTTPRK